MKIIVYTSVAPNSLDRFPIKTSSFLGWEIKNRPCKITPQQGLTEWMLECWQQVITDGLAAEEFILVFKHNDFEVADEPNFLSQIIGIISSRAVDLIGVAGTESFDPIQRKPNGSYMAWTEYEPTDRKCGLLMRRINGMDSWSFYGAPGTVKVIDGCCMVCSGRMASQIEALLTPKFHRDWYDIAFSYNAHLAGFKVYVINTLVRHESGGEFGLNWLKEGHEFFAYYGQFKTPEDQDNGHQDRLPDDGETAAEPAGIPGGVTATD